MILKSRSPTFRIGIVTHYMPPHIGGIEMIADSLCQIYKAAGFAVRWIASRVSGPGALPRDDAIQVRCWNGLERHCGVPWPMWGWEGVREVVRLAQWADILHVHDCLYFGSVLAAVVARYVKKPMIVSQHIGFVQYDSPILNWLEYGAYATVGRLVLRKASRLVYCTAAAKEFIQCRFAKPTVPTVFVPNGIDTRNFRPPTKEERASARRKLQLPETDPIVLFIGRLVEKKGVNLIVAVSQQMLNCHFVLVGDGPLRPEPKANLTWFPFIPAKEVQQVYRAADCFLLPSHSEGFPVSVLEAMATGVPSVLSKGEPFALNLQKQEACLLSERSPSALSDALNRLLSSKELSQSIGTRGRIVVLEKYSLEVMAQKYVRAIRELMEGADSRQ